MAYIGTTPKDVRSFGKAKFDFTATASQTVFTGADDDGKTLGFTAGQISVYVNGILMDDSDFTVSNGNTVTLASPANAGDIISVVALQTDIPNSDYVPATGGTFSGDVAFQGDLTVDTSTLFVDSTNNRVGVGTTSPLTNMHLSDTGDTGIQLTKQGSVAARVKTVAGALAIGVDGANGDTERMRITSTGSVGIGISNPSSYQANADDLVVGNLVDAGTGITIVSGTASLGSIHFADSPTGDDSYRGFIQYDHASNYMRFATNATERMRIDGGGNFLLKTTSVDPIADASVGATYYANGNTWRFFATGTSLAIGTSVTSDMQQYYYHNGTSASKIGSISNSTTGTTYNTTSDRRLKTDIEPISDGTEKLMAMNPVTHKWVADPEAPAIHGFIAQEMQEIAPEAVSGEPDGKEMMSMDYGRITPILVAAFQDAHKRIEVLEERLKVLEENK